MKPDGLSFLHLSFCNLVTNLANLQLQEEWVDEAQFALSASGASVLSSHSLGLIAAGGCDLIHGPVLDI